MSKSIAEMGVSIVDETLISVAQMASFDLNLSPSHLLHRAQQVAGDLHIASFGPAGLTQRQLAVLIILGAGDGISQTELVTKTGIDRSTLAEMVARMEKKDLMVRAKSATDSRANAVHLTLTGREVLSDALPKLALIDKGVLAFVSAGRREILVDLLTRIALPEPSKKALKLIGDTKKPKKKDKKKKEKKKKADKA